MSAPPDLPIGRRARLALALGLAFVVSSAPAEDLVVRPASGDGFVVAAQGGAERLRVGEAGPVLVPGLPTAGNAEDRVLCFDGTTGQLGPCDPAVFDVFQGPPGPAGTAALADGSGSAYNGGVTLACGDPIDFATSNLGSDLTLSVNDTLLTVATAGRYLISYHLHVLTPNQMKTKVEIDSAAEPALTVDYLGAGTNLSYNASSIVTLGAGSTVALTTECSMGQVRVRPDAGASLTLVRIE